MTHKDTLRHLSKYTNGDIGIARYLLNTLWRRYKLYYNGDEFTIVQFDPHTNDDDASDLEESYRQYRDDSGKRWLVAVYLYKQRFGGKEEGGWWYDSGDLARVVKIFRNRYCAIDYCALLNLKLKSRVIGPNVGRREYTSAASTGEYRATVCEDAVPTHFPEAKPRYE